MLKTIWLHIGTAKSGTTAIQHFCAERRDWLRARGVTYISPRGRTSANKLAIALIRDRTKEIAELSADLEGQIAACTTPRALMSSEMFYGMEPARILEALPSARGRDLNVAAYVRRQDLYLEAKYIQKLKNGRFKGTVQDYIAKFDGSGADYLDGLRPWMALGVPVLVRVYERPRLREGSTVSDLLSYLGIYPTAKEMAAVTTENTSPSYGRLQLLQSLEGAGLAKVKQIQRRLPPDPMGRASVFDQEERRALIARFGGGNEALRAVYAPDVPSLFDESDLDGPGRTGDAGFTPAQLEEIQALLAAVAAAYGIE